MLTLITRHAPYGSSRAKEALDIALASAAFELDISVVFLGDGIFQLLPNQDAQAVEQKSLLRNIEALELFGVEQLLVSAEDMAARNILKGDLPAQVTVLDDQALQQHLAHSKTVLTF